MLIVLVITQREGHFGSVLTALMITKREGGVGSGVGVDYIGDNAGTRGCGRKTC